VWQGAAAVVGAGVDESVGPFALERLDEALDLAVGARPARPGGEVADAAAGEQLAQRAVLDVAPGVVAHQPPRLDALLGEGGERPLDEASDRLGLGVGEHLGVGEAGVVVDERVHDVVAEPAPLVLGRAGAIGGDRVAGLGEAGERRPVDVQQIAGTGPLVAAHWLARLRLRPGAAAAPLSADAFLQAGRQQPRRAVRPARAIEQARERPPLLRARRAPPN